MDNLVFDGVMISSQKRIFNPKGDILHGMKNSDSGYAGFGEVYFSMVHCGAMKGWKRHRLATLNIVVPYGAIRFIVYDDRSDSLTQGKFLDITASSKNYVRLTICPGLWMAFMGIGDGVNILTNICNMEHDPGESDNCELGTIPFEWNNKGLNS